MYITKNKKQTFISYQAKRVLQRKMFLWISNKQYLVRRTKYVALPFLQLYNVCFAKAALESFSKTLVAVGLVQIDLGGQGSDGAACIIFCMSVLSSSATNGNIFSLLERIKSVHEKLLMFAITICGVFLL